MRKPEKEREAEYIAHLVEAPWQVKVCKLADIFVATFGTIKTIVAKVVDFVRIGRNLLRRLDAHDRERIGLHHAFHQGTHTIAETRRGQYIDFADEESFDRRVVDVAVVADIGVGVEAVAPAGRGRCVGCSPSSRS